MEDSWQQVRDGQQVGGASGTVRLRPVSLSAGEVTVTVEVDAGAPGEVWFSDGSYGVTAWAWDGGAENPAGAKFCIECGTALAATPASTEPRAPEVAPPPLPVPPQPSLDPRDPDSDRHHPVLDGGDRIRIHENPHTIGASEREPGG